MKYLFLFLFFTCFYERAQSQDSLAQYMAALDSLEASFQFQTGSIPIKGGTATITIPTGFKFLDASQAQRVLVELWGNPKSDDQTLGMILPESKRLMGDTGYVFNIQYDEMGFVKDDDAHKINYDDLLGDMQKDIETANEERAKIGYEPVALIGWASKPFYDQDKKILHWAKEIKFGESEFNTLNYNVRVLGRKGVLILNAISDMTSLPDVQKDIPAVLDMVQFNEGFRYADFNSKTDDIAAWTIGGLVAGKILAKAGFFALILKFWKVIALAVAAFGASIWKRMKAKNETPAA
jgi:uncharacterized membrane-anchored protein